MTERDLKRPEMGRIFLLETGGNFTNNSREKRKRENKKSFVLQFDSCILKVGIIYTTLRLKVKLFALMGRQSRKQKFKHSRNANHLIVNGCAFYSKFL